MQDRCITSLLTHLFILLQESLCSPSGTECYQNAKSNARQYSTPCQGLYADVIKDKEHKKVEDIKKFNAILKDYEEYKRGSRKDIAYPSKLKSITFKKI